MDGNTPEAPEIKAEVNKEEPKDRGFFGNLLAKLGGGGATADAGLGAGGLGAGGAGVGGLGAGAGLGGGLLATKAGLIGLILVGTTVAGGIGVIGYKAFGPTEA